MNKMMKLALAAAVGLTLAACAEEKPAEEAPTEEPKQEEAAKVEVPAYEPTGEHAELKKAGAEGVTVDNAADQAKALEEELNKEIQTLEGGAEGGEAAGGEAAGGETK